MYHRDDRHIDDRQMDIDRYMYAKWGGNSDNNPYNI